MAYSVEVIQRAKDRLAQDKADRESRYGRRLAEAYAQIPRLKQIDQELRHSMALAARNVFAGGGQVRQTMEQIRQANLSLQQERAELIEKSFGPGYLDEDPVCQRCGGSGYVGSKMCDCLMELCRQEQRKELTFLSAGQECFEQFRLEYYPDRVDPQQGVNIRAVMDRTFQVCRRYAHEFSSRSGNLLFSGGTGLGKTFLSACIARTVADRGYSVMYESAGHLFARLERAKFSGDEQARRDAEKYTVCDLLIIDDLGTEMGGQFTTAALYGLINDRILSGKAMIISTNLNSADLEKRYSPAIASRLRGEFLRLAFLGEDIRLKKSRGARS